MSCAMRPPLSAPGSAEQQLLAGPRLSGHSTRPSRRSSGPVGDSGAYACGQVLAEAKDGSVFIEKIDSGGNADEHGVVQVPAPQRLPIHPRPPDDLLLMHTA